MLGGDGYQSSIFPTNRLLQPMSLSDLMQTHDWTLLVQIGRTTKDPSFGTYSEFQDQSHAPHKQKNLYPI